MKKSIYLLLFLSTASLYAQEAVLAVKEQLATIKLGDSSTSIQYASTEEGFFSPNGPFIDGKGVLYFYPTYNREYLLEYRSGNLNRIGLLQNQSDYEKLISASYILISQQGTISVPGNGLTFNYYSNEFRPKMFDWGDGKVRAMDYILTPVPNGMFLNSMSQKVSLSAEFIADGSIQIRNSDETRTWLTTQPGGFSIGDDGLLYRNGMLWSAVRPKERNLNAKVYIGRLASGHAVWAGGGLPGMERYFSIVNAAGHWEMILELPWAGVFNEQYAGYFNYGLGPWGELYCLIPPPAIDPNTYYKPKPSLPAELVVVRNHLKYFGRLNDGDVRLRSAPTTSGDILGTYPNKTGFRILERTGKNETIAGMTSDWVKVRLLDGTEGWFFGSFVHNLYDGPNGNPPPWPNVADW